MFRRTAVLLFAFALGLPTASAQGQEKKTHYVEVVQDQHKLFETTKETHVREVKVPPGHRMIEFDPKNLGAAWEEISAAECSGTRFELIKDPHFDLPIGIRVVCDLKSGPKGDQYRGWLKGNLTVKYRPVKVE
jgi:hypothetical protein